MTTGFLAPATALIVGTLGLAAVGQQAPFVRTPPPRPPVDAPFRPTRPATETVMQPGVEGVLDSFKTHPLVGLSITHGSAPGGEFYNALVRHPRFAREVGHVVVEFGGAIHQGIIDRYVAGEPVAYTELRKVWTDVVGWIPVAVTNQSYVDFFAEVRRVNRGLPPGQRIRVWLAEPKIDWSKADTEEWLAHRWEAQTTRDRHAGEVINRNILAQNRKALVIYGAGHFPRTTMGGWVEAEHPGAFYFVSGEYSDDACAALLPKAAAIWPAPALAAPARGGMPSPDLVPCATQGSRQNPFIFDAVLFLGPRETLKGDAVIADYFLDPDYRKEMERRFRITDREALPVWRASFPIRKANYRDLDAAGYAELLDAMFARYDRDRDGAVSFEEYSALVP